MVKSLIQQLARLVVTNRIRLSGDIPSLSEYKSELRQTKVGIQHVIQEYFMILLGVGSASFGLSGFLLPNSFIDGGVTGISLIVNELTPVSLSIWIVIINAPFMFMGYNVMGRQFALRSVFAILCLAFAVHYIPFPIITDDKLLIAVFGGFFLGLGIGLAIRGGSVIDGTEVLAVYLSKKTSLTIGDIILILNVIIFSVGAYVFSVEIALYAILTYLATSKTVDFVVDGIEEYMAVTIISKDPEQVRLGIINKLGRGCTLYNASGGYAKDGAQLTDSKVVYTVITRLEMAALKTLVDKIDAKAFVVMHPVKDVKGGMIKKRPLSK